MFTSAQREAIAQAAIGTGFIGTCFMLENWDLFLSWSNSKDLGDDFWETADKQHVESARQILFGMSDLSK